MDCDSDHAGERSERKSTTGIVARYHNMVLSTQAVTQAVVALSSGEAEFYAIVRSAVFGLYTRNVVRWLERLSCRIRVFSDSSAARGMAKRLGVGKKAKHIDVQCLMVQDLVADGSVIIEGQAGSSNVSDAGTKYVTAKVMKSCLDSLAMERVSRRS